MKAKITISSIMIKGVEDLRLDIGLSVTVSSGQCLVITGPSGSGKSLTLRLLSGITPEIDHQTNIVCDNLQFEVSIDGDAGRLSRLESVHYVPQDLAQFFISPVAADEVELSFEISGANIAEKAQSRRRMFWNLGVNDVTYSQIGTLSAGEQVMVSIASAIARRPSLLLLDEPYSILSKGNRTKLSLALKEYCCNGGILIITTHEPSVAEKLLGDLSPIIHRIKHHTYIDDKPVQSVLSTLPIPKLGSGEHTLYELKGADLRANMDDRFLFSFDDLTIHRGGCILLEGNNGSGKTTFLQYIAGLFDLWPQNAVFDGRPVDTAPPSYPDDIGFVPHSPMSQAFSGKVEEYLRFVGTYADIPSKTHEQRYDFISGRLAKLGITPSAFVGDLSYGQQKVLSISRYLNCPKLLLIDEVPTFSDPNQLIVVLEILTYFHTNGVTMIFTSHAPTCFKGFYNRHLRIEDAWLHEIEG